MANEFVIKNGAIIKEGGTLTIGDPLATGFTLPPTDGTSGQALVTNGSGAVDWTTITSTATPGGSNTQIQYNNAGLFAGDTGFTTDGAGNLTVDGSLSVDDLSFDGNSISGTSATDGDIVLVPNGSGLVITQSGYDMSTGPDHALATKGYVDANAGGASVERLRFDYTAANAIGTITDTTSGINSTNVINSVELEITFTGYVNPPSAIFTYGYQDGTDEYNLGHVNSGFGTRKVDGNSGNLFGNMNNTHKVTLDLNRTNTGANFLQHAWVVFIF